MLFRRRHRPELSVVVVVHNMAREAPRTLYSLSAKYQRNISAADYEVIVVDNGSTPPLDAEAVKSFGDNFRLLRLDPAPPSPAAAVNRGLAEARGKTVGVMVDGARLLSPGVLHFARHGVALYPRAVVVTLGWYLGRDLQRWSIEAGYDQKREDEMLAAIGWPQDGYRLFEISAFDECSVDGWFSQIEESNALFLSRDCWDRLGGFDERFDLPGGGYVNLDTLARALELPESELVILLGEGTFHQVHGGIATNHSFGTLRHSLAKWDQQYRAIRNRPWRTPSPARRTYVGSLPQAVLPHLARSIVEPVRGLPVGPAFDRSLWLTTPSPRPADPVCAALVDLAEGEFRARRFQAAAAVARIARAHAPDEPAPQRLLTIAGAWLRDAGEPTDDQRAGFHLARAKAYRLLADTTAAAAEYRAALAADAGLAEAASALAELRPPKDDTARASPPSRQAILVLGMHRSGTSALSGVLCALGAAAPKKTLMGSHPCNLRGFFEALSIAQSHDDFLAAAGSCWHDWRQFDLAWARSPAAAPHTAKIKSVLSNEFADEPLIVLKDPRICRFVPYTASVLADLGMSVVAVLPVRNPLEVALSLQRRDNFAVSDSVLLWLRHVLDAEYYSRGLPRCFVSYEDLLRDWRREVERICQQTGVALPNRFAQGGTAVDQFLTAELHHERATPDESKYNREVSPLARRTYRVLLEICARGESKQSADQLDAARAEFDEHCRRADTLVPAEAAAPSR
jgi:glycosyltransferase involved in cell wall biosynthesis